jgi:hypothetical protein
MSAFCWQDIGALPVFNGVTLRQIFSSVFRVGAVLCRVSAFLESFCGLK